VFHANFANEHLHRIKKKTAPEARKRKREEAEKRARDEILRQKKGAADDAD
jgi:hypothetical protein